MLLRPPPPQCARTSLKSAVVFPARAGGRTRRTLATVSPSIIPQTRPPPPPTPTAYASLGPNGDTPSPLAHSDSRTPYLDSRILQALSQLSRSDPNLHDIIGHYLDETGNVLSVSLPYESRPSEDRRVRFGEEESSREIVTIAHCAMDGAEHKITMSSGFALNVGRPGRTEGEEEMLIVSCAHTLAQIRQSPLLQLKEIPPRDPSHHIPTGTFVCIGTGPSSLEVYPAQRIVTALPRSDVVILSCSLPKGKLKSLPVSPYPAPVNTKVRAHFVSLEKGKPCGPGASRWTPWVGDTWGCWAHGTIVGYRDFSGNATEPGTYDALSHMLFTPFPTAGSSGGPVVDEESGAVVGVMLGSRMDNAKAGVRGWGIPAETIFEMFSLPGLEGKK